MSVGTAIKRFRRRDRKTWRSEGRLTRPSTADPEFDDDTGEEEAGEPTQIYEGRCQVRATSGTGRRDVQVGEREARLSSLRAKFPADTDVRVDDWLEITASTYDAGIVGRTFRVTDVLWDDWQINRVAMLEEVTSTATLEEVSS